MDDGRRVIGNVLTIAMAVFWLLPLAAQLAHAQLDERVDPLRQLQEREFDPSQLMSSWLRQVEYTNEELEAIERIRIPIQTEIEYGEQSVEKFREELERRRIKIANRGKDVAYVQRLVDQLHPLMRRGKEYKKLQVFVVQSPEVMAWAYPGGTIFVYEGLLNFVPSEAALVAVLGHEISHIDRGHQLFDLKRMHLIRQTLNSDSFSLQKLAANQSFLLKSMTRPFRPEEELVADRDGADWAFQLGYDPREMATLFVRMQQREQRKKNRKPGNKLAEISFLQTHPASDVRIKGISDVSEGLINGDPGRPLYVGIKNVRQRESRQENEHPDEFFR